MPGASDLCDLSLQPGLWSVTGVEGLPAGGQVQRAWLHTRLVASLQSDGGRGWAAVGAGKRPSGRA